MIHKKSYLMILILMILSLLIIAIMPNYSLATNYDPIDNPGQYKPGAITNSDASAITGKANQIIGIIVGFGVVISAITLTILGIKFMVGSVEEKAEYKKSMIPYIIGSILLFATSTIVGIIAKLVEG